MKARMATAKTAARPGLIRPVLDFLVDVDGGVPAGEHEHGEEEPGREVALPADPAEAEPAAGDRERAVMVAEHRHQPRDGKADQDRVLDHSHDDLSACGGPDADDRDHEHDRERRRWR